MPRITMSPEDALFCATFFHKLHTIETSNFSSLQYYDRVVKDIFPVIYCATDREAGCLGVFLRATFEPLKRWRFDKHLYEKEAASKPGFSVAIGSQARCSYDQYCTVFFKWYDKITKIALHCLDQYQDHGRACLLVLIKLDGVYPARKRVNALLMERLDIIKKQEAMKDLQAMAQRYHTLLNKQKDLLFDDAVNKRDVPGTRPQNLTQSSKRQPTHKVAGEPSPDRAIKTNITSSNLSGKIAPTSCNNADEPVNLSSTATGSTATGSQKHDAEHSSYQMAGSKSATLELEKQSQPGAESQLKSQGATQVHLGRIAKGRSLDAKLSSNADSRSGRSTQEDSHGSTSLSHRNRGDTKVQGRGRTTERPNDRNKQIDTHQARVKDLPSPLNVAKSGASTRQLDQHQNRSRGDDATITAKRGRPMSQNDNDRTSSKRSREEDRRRGGGRR